MIRDWYALSEHFLMSLITSEIMACIAQCLSEYKIHNSAPQLIISPRRDHHSHNWTFGVLSELQDPSSLTVRSSSPLKHSTYHRLCLISASALASLSACIRTTLVSLPSPISTHSPLTSCLLWSRSKTKLKVFRPARHLTSLNASQRKTRSTSHRSILIATRSILSRLVLYARSNARSPAGEQSRVSKNIVSIEKSIKIVLL
jgi:hypothetical protein